MYRNNGNLPKNYNVDMFRYGCGPGAPDYNTIPIPVVCALTVAKFRTGLGRTPPPSPLQRLKEGALITLKPDTTRGT